MIGRSLILAIASITCWLNSFGTVLTPMIPVGFNRLDRLSKGAQSARGPCANGFWKSARSVREVDHQTR